MPQLRPFVRVWLPVSLIFTLGLTLPIIKKATAGGRNEPIVVLQTSEGPLQTGAPVSALFTSPAEENTVYLVDGFNGQVEAYKDDPTPSLRPFADTSGPLAIRSRDYFAYIDGRSKIVLAVPMGKTIGRIDTPPAISVALLSNGNIIVASPHENIFFICTLRAADYLKGSVR